MKFDDLDKTMRSYERSLDQILDSNFYMVARLDGRGFTRLTKGVCAFDAPFDIRFRNLMTDTVASLMNCGFHVMYGFTESDEISLLFHPDEAAFGRKVRKYNSILAGTASAAFSLKLGQPGIFDCRMVPLPDMEHVKDYFLWRQEDANRNALNSHCYWMMRKKGASVSEATDALDGKTVEYKKELLFQNGIDFEKLPGWQKHGIGMFWETVTKEGFNPITQEKVTAIRKRLCTDYELPTGEAYAKLLETLI